MNKIKSLVAAYYQNVKNLQPKQITKQTFLSHEVRILIQVQHTTIIQFRGFSYVDLDEHQNIIILIDYIIEGQLANSSDKELKSLCQSNYDNIKRQIILVGIA
ncbi:hypothetical protein M9Y10_011088 [Tritrichomonas musculus]|uniref:Protein kinase domain-containing protein n=1 Tax=Tritrichomonas musculus TaxID=1915356 RepID=A0ABR2INU7_9EUKA